MRFLLILLCLTTLAIADEKKIEPKPEKKEEPKPEKKEEKKPEVKESRLKPFAPKDGGFQCVLPGEAKFREQKISDVTVKMWTWEEKEIGYAITRSDFPAEKTKTTKEAIDEQLNLSRDGIIASLRGEKGKESILQLNQKYPGREFEVKFGRAPKFLRTRIYYVGSRLYQLSAIGSEEGIKAEEVTQFLDSLKLSD